jgi:phenylacetate-CoA ligase
VFGTAFAQLRFAASVLFGIPFDLRSLGHLVDAVGATRREFGALPSDAGDPFGGPSLDKRDRRELQLRRFRQQARLAARETAYYADLLRHVDVDGATFGPAEIARLPITPKSAFQADPDAFLRRSARVSLRTTTTGTTGRPAVVCFSAYELQVVVLLGAMRLLMGGGIGPDDVVQLNTSSRATLGNVSFAGACARVGALVCPVGLVDPEVALALLAEPRHIPGKRPRVSVLLTYPSYLGELVERGFALGYRPSDFGLGRIVVGGEIVTAGLKARCERLFGPVAFDEGYGMTETWGMGAQRCAEGHLHFEPTQGLLEVLDPETGAPSRPGEIGTIVATPFAPYRDATILLRYDTEDLVRVPADPPGCALHALPATSQLLGKRRLAVRHADGWVTPRDVLEALEALEAVPLPARCGFRAVPGGVAVEAVVRHASPQVRDSIMQALRAAGVPVRQLGLVEDRNDLEHPLPLRGDLREAAFDAPHGPGAPGPAIDGLLQPAGAAPSAGGMAE